MTKTIEEASKLWCPFSSTEVNDSCVADKCMAWEWDDSEELDVEETNKYANLREIMTGHYSNPIFKKSNKGLCKLIHKCY